MQPKFEKTKGDVCGCESCQELENPVCWENDPCCECHLCTKELAEEMAGLADANFEYARATGRCA